MLSRTPRIVNLTYVENLTDVVSVVSSSLKNNFMLSGYLHVLYLTYEENPTIVNVRFLAKNLGTDYVTLSENDNTK